MFDVLSITDFLDRKQCTHLAEEVRASSGKPATVYGSSPDGSVESRVRQVTRASVSDATTKAVVNVLAKITPQLSAHFNIELTEIEPPQFLHYRRGDFFVAHQDGNTPLLHDESRFRKVSIIIFLNEPSEGENGGYTGGSLLLHGSYPNYDTRRTIPPVRGSLAAFRSEVTHEVTPIESGERFTIVSWYRSAEHRQDI